MRGRILDAAEELIFTHGFHATSVDAVLAVAGASKGAFFHHFASKADLGLALVDRYACADLELLEEYMVAAEGASDHPAVQLVDFIRRFEESAYELVGDEPGCLYALFVYERVPDAAGLSQIVVDAIRSWRERIVAKLQAIDPRPPNLEGVDLAALADHVFATFEGAYVLARATGEPDHVRAQVAQLRRYLELLLAS
jgi:TetR/AcrR family transcriptional regulator, transcriptional repressor for nem operon